MNELEIFDYPKLLDTYYNEEDIIKNVMRIFLKTVNEQLMEIESMSADTPDRAKVRFIAHSIKGSAYNLTCTKLGNYAYEIQKICDCDAALDLKMIAVKFRELFSETEKKLTVYL